MLAAAMADFSPLATFQRRLSHEKKASRKRAHAKQKRLSPEDRRKEFVAKTTEILRGGRIWRRNAESPVLDAKAQMISDALDIFLAGFPRVQSNVSPRRLPMKAAG